MVDDTTTNEQIQAAVESSAEETKMALTVSTADLNKESAEILSQVVQEKDRDKLKDLTYLFNENNVKKQMVRQDAYNNLKDLVVGQLTKRVEKAPDEIDTDTLLNIAKTVSDMEERGRKQINEAIDEPQPIIQEVNLTQINAGSPELPRESRTKITNALAQILGSAAAAQAMQQAEEAEHDEQTVDATYAVKPEEDNGELAGDENDD